MSATYLPSFVTLHLPDGENLLLEGRVKSGRGTYGLKPGSREVLPGSASFELDSYDSLITISDDGTVPLELLERCSVTVGFHGMTLFSGRVRQATVKETDRKTTVSISVRDSAAEFAGIPAIDIGNRPAEQTGERVHLVLDHPLVGWGSTAAYRDVDPGTVRCVQIPPRLDDGDKTRYGQAGSPIEMLNLIAATEGGRWFIRHGRPASDREYNRGLLTFRQRQPAADPVLHVDTVNGTLDGVSALRPTGALTVTPSREELYNRVRLRTPDLVDPLDVISEASIERWGERLYERAVLSEGQDAEALAEYIRSVYEYPRDAIKQVRLSGWLWPPAVTAKVYALTVDDVIRLTYVESNTGQVVETLQQVNRVRFDFRPGDNTEGGAIGDITVDLEAPAASASWRYGVRGASELGTTTVFTSEPGTNQRIPQQLKDWEQGEHISSEEWNAHVVNLGVVVYDSDEERTRTRDQEEARLRKALGLPAVGSGEPPGDPRLRELLKRMLNEIDFRVLPATDQAGRETPADGVLSVNAATLEVYAWDSALGGDRLIGRVGARELPGVWTLDGTARSRLDYGNVLIGDSDG